MSSEIKFYTRIDKHKIPKLGGREKGAIVMEIKSENVVS